jgi:TonB-linked SusC/RagA family outer membrane protein
MKHTILNVLQTGSNRLAVCTLVLGLSSSMAYAQTDISGEEAPAAVKQPKRSPLPMKKYPMVTIKGKIVEAATGKGIAGIQLRSLANNRYTGMSDEDGSFSIQVPVFTTALYVFSPGYISQQVAIAAGDSSQNLKIKMLSDQFQSMYGTDTKIVASRTAEINRFGVTVDNEIENKLGGDMRSILRSAAVDGGASMFIRGINSINADAQPLIVIDGVEQDMQRTRSSLHEGQFNNILANIMPDDIENVTVLKNGTALYGARGANGVVIITTKRGHSMATRIDANISGGFQFIPKLPTMMNASQYRSYASEMLGTIENISDKNIDFRFQNDDPNGYYYHTYHNDTDWKDYVYRKAFTQNYSIDVQGGDDVGMYHLSVGYVGSQNTVKKSDFNRMNVRFNTDIDITKDLSTKFDISISRTNNNVFDDGFSSDLTASAITSPTALALIKSPLVSAYQYNSLLNNGAGGFSSLLSDADDIFSQLGSTYSLANPLSILTNGNGDNKNKAETTYFTVHVAPSYKLGSGFKLGADMCYTLNRNSQRYYRPYSGVPSFSISELGTVTSLVVSMFSKEQNFVGKLQLDWNKQMGKHTVNAFVGARYNYFSYDNSDLSTQYTTAQNDKNPTLSTSGYPGVKGVNDVWKNIMWYGNVDYNYMNRYFATVSLAMESNSRFGSDADALKLFGVRWAAFPSIQAGWVMTNENWFPKNVGINYLKLTAGFDMSGNDDISNYAARTSFTTVKYNSSATGIQLTNIGNDKIQWESTKKWNVGLESYLLDNRLGISFDYFIHNTSNLLTLKSFSSPVGGINRYWSNGGELKNEGFEVNVTGKPIVTKDWRMEVGASVGHYKNKVTKLPDGDYTSSVYGEDNILTSVGNPVALFYGYETAGVFSTDADAKAAGKNGSYLYMTDDAGNSEYFQAGDVHFVDRDGNGKIDANDKTVIGDPNPDIYGNIFANLNWKDITLSLNFNYSLGNDVYNYQRSILNSGSTFYNQQVAEVNRWRYEGQVTDIPRAYYGDPKGNNRFSDRWIEDGSYLRLKAINLSYKVPVPGSWTWLQGLTVWAEMQNVFTLTKYLGSDPEFSIGSSAFYQGIDCGNMAQGRSVSLGLKINL